MPSIYWSATNAVQGTFAHPNREMDTRMNIDKLMIVTCLLGAVDASAQTQCPPIQDAGKGKLLEFVAKKYKVPSKLTIEISDISLVDSTCYRKLVFSAKESSAGFHLELYASPDLRFLTRELLDSTVDPLLEERRKADALAAGLSLAGLPSLGPKAAPVTIAVFSDFQCPYCAGFADLVKEVLSDESLKARVVFHTFPLPMHSWARPAAEAALCAQEQGDNYFWSVHDFMFEHQQEITPDTLFPKLAAAAKSFDHFSQQQFATCLVERKTATRVDEDIAFAQKNGINATPTVFVNGRQTKIVAADQLRTIIQQLSATAPIAQADCGDLQCRRDDAAHRP